MQKRFKTKLTPIKILRVWIISMIVLTPVFMFFSNIGASGGEQKPLITLATMIVVAIYGAAIFSILTPLLFRQWFKKNWWFIFVIILTVIPAAYDMWDKHFRNSYYSSIEMSKNVNGDEIETKIDTVSTSTILLYIKLSLNSRYPKQIDDISTLDSVSILGDDTLQYNYTAKVNSSRIDTVGFERFIQKNLGDSLSFFSPKERTLFKQRGITVMYSYKDSTGHFWFNGTLYPSN